MLSTSSFRLPKRRVLRCTAHVADCQPTHLWRESIALNRTSTHLDVAMRLKGIIFRLHLL